MPGELLNAQSDDCLKISHTQVNALLLRHLTEYSSDFNINLVVVDLLYPH